ncbi:hypothetical protein ACHAXS_012068 [Conticribra weissflogii]
MIRFVIILIFLVGDAFTGNIVFVTAATIPPSGSQPSSWSGGSISKHNHDDVPIISDNILPEKRRKKSKRAQNRRHRSIDRSGMKIFDRDSNKDDSDWKDGSDILPPLFSFGANPHDDNSNEKKIYDRWFRNYKLRNMIDASNSESEYDEESAVIGPSINSFRRWTYEKTGFYIPKININFEPVTSLKLRKSWHNVIPGAIIRVGADFETQTMMGTGVWRLRGCLEDKLIGGRFSIKGKRSRSGGQLVEYSKSWLFPGAGSLATRFNLCATYDMSQRRGSARFGFKTVNSNGGGNVETLGVFGGIGRQGFSIIPTIPLDGQKGHMILEAKTYVDVPQPEFVVGMDMDDGSNDRGSFGMGFGGDIDVDIEELNLVINI